MLWNEYVAAWSHPPVDHLNRYVSAQSMLALPDDELRELINRMHSERFTGWRNHGNLWRDVLGLDTTHGKRVLDFGCGVGLEALELVRAENTVDIADISDDNLALADRVIQIFGFENRRLVKFKVKDEPPYISELAGHYDVFHCSGVLHHCRRPQAIMKRAWELLAPGGEARLMLYSDVGWQQATGEPVPDVWACTADHPEFQRFVVHFDQVGDYADWYNEEKLTAWFDRWFSVDRVEYLTPHKQYLGAVLTRRDITL